MDKESRDLEKRQHRKEKSLSASNSTEVTPIKDNNNKPCKKGCDIRQPEFHPEARTAATQSQSSEMNNYYQQHQYQSSYHHNQHYTHNNNNRRPTRGFGNQPAVFYYNQPHQQTSYQQQYNADHSSDSRTAGRSSGPWCDNKDSDTNDQENSGGLLRHPVYYEIGTINGQINRMDLSTMKDECRKLKLDTRGKREALKRRLKEYWKATKLEAAGMFTPPESRNVDFFVVIDFEATCEERNPAGFKHEIIEFPAVLVKAGNEKHHEKPEIVDIFHSFCRPVINPRLSEFCLNLTGIDQSTVDKADSFPDVHERFEEWLYTKHRLGKDFTYLVVTDGPFDVARFLYLQMEHLGRDVPEYAHQWVNLRKAFSNFYTSDFYANSRNAKPAKLPGLQNMLTSLGLEFEGQPHSGLDDAKNIARVLIRLLEDRAFVRMNEKLLIDKKPEEDHPEAEDEEDDGGVDEESEDQSEDVENQEEVAVVVEEVKEEKVHHTKSSKRRFRPQSGRLNNVIPVPRREAEDWFKTRKKIVKKNQIIENSDEEGEGQLDEQETLNKQTEKLKLSIMRQT